MTRHILLAAILLCGLGCQQTAPPPGPPATAPAAVMRHWPADLAGVANMGFADDTAGDGTGGWSDQGWENSFAEFECSRRSFGDVPFTILDPAANGGRAIVSFRHETLVQGPETVEAPFPAGARGRYLYLLHTACHAGQAARSGSALATITLRGKDGSRGAVEVVLGKDVADWWNPVPLANGAVVASKPNQSAMVGVYLSRFDLGREVAADSVRATSTGAALWILVGATLSADDHPLPAAKPLVITPDARWKALPTGDLVVKPGTALDRSAWVDSAPAGSRGRVIATPDGHLAFAGDPATPVRFFGCTVPHWAGKNPEEADPEALAEAVRRQGYNMVRYHFLDHFLAGRQEWGRKIDRAGIAAHDARSAAGQAFDSAALDQLDRLNAAFKRHGIYLYVDAMTSPAGYYPVNAWTKDSGCPNLKMATYDDPAAREHYRRTVTQLLTHRNPYTGLSMAEDPMVAVVLCYNESEINFWGGAGWKQDLLPPWRAFLARRYADPAAWIKAWGGRGEPPHTFAEAAIFDMGDLWRSGAPGRDVAEFLAGIEQETTDFLTGVIRGAGYPGLVSHFDYFKNLRYYLPRARMDAVSMHGYHASPRGFAQPGAKILQSSALSDGLGWLRGTLIAKIAGRPLLVTEYGQVYWNRYRYEEGLSVGAFAALQRTDALFAHSTPVLFAGRTIKPFAVAIDPIARASQVVTALAWREAAVAPARHSIHITLPREAALAGSQSAIPGDLSRLLLLSGCAVQVEGGPAITSTPDLPIPLRGAARVMNTVGQSSVAEQPDQGGFADLVGRMRQAGLLPAGNRTDPAQGIYESDTGEITLDARNRRLRVATPTLAGVCTDRIDSPVACGGLTLEAASLPASVTIASLDGRAMAEAQRLLLVLATDARNDGERYADSEAMTLERLGSGGVLVRTGSFTVDLGRSAGAPPLRAWALALDGRRQDELTVQPRPGGLRLVLDTAAWACGPTPFIEMAER